MIYTVTAPFQQQICFAQGGAPSYKLVYTIPSLTVDMSWHFYHKAHLCQLQTNLTMGHHLVLIHEPRFSSASWPGGAGDGGGLWHFQARLGGQLLPWLGRVLVVRRVWEPGTVVSLFLSPPSVATSVGWTYRNWRWLDSKVCKEL